MTTSASRTVLVSGSSGLVGSAVSSRLEASGNRVIRLVRSREAGDNPNSIYWNIADGELDQNALEEVAPDAVIHLAGESVYGLRWTTEKKRRIWESRTKGTTLLAQAIALLKRKPATFLSASASGIYGDHGDDPVTEESQLGEGFLAEVCKAWEAATLPAEEAGIRTAHMRFGVVLARTGLLLKGLVPLYNAGLAGPVGFGRRYLPWIAIDDAVGAILHLLDADINGPVNLASPGSVTGAQFGRALGSVLHRPSVLPVPPLLISLIGGEMAREIALKSIRMEPTRLLADGFQFRYGSLADALKHELGVG